MSLSSLFGNKKDRDGKSDTERDPATVPAPKPGSNPPDANPAFPDTQTADTRTSSSSTFQATVNQNDALASRIDEIEAEMARELAQRGPLGATPPLVMRSPPAEAFLPPAAAEAPRTTAGANANSPPITGPGGTAAYESPTDILGATLDMQAMEVAASNVSPVIEEAAVLYANGQGEAAVAALEAAVREDRLGSSTQLAWQTLLELHQLLDRKSAFEALAQAYRQRFDLPAAPAFQTATALPNASVAQLGNEIALPSVLDEHTRNQFERVKDILQDSAEVIIDASAVEQVTPHGANLLLRTIKAFKRSQYRLILKGAQQLNNVIREGLEVGRRDPSDLPWLLLLELYNLLEQQNEFEEACIDYCVTFEISPPSWDPAPANLQAAAGSFKPTKAQPYTEVPAGSFTLDGVLEGKAIETFEALRAHAGRQARIDIDCRSLHRVDFAAAGNLMNLLFGFNAMGKEIRFWNVNYLVAAMFAVMGITEVASLQRRQL